MQAYKIEPLISFENIPFGMERAAVRKLIFTTTGLEQTEFIKGYNENSTDAYENFHIFYDKFDRFEAVEFFDSATVFMDGQVVFPNEMDMIFKIFPDLKEDMGIWISEKNSIGIYAPENKMESILFGKEGYYNLV